MDLLCKGKMHVIEREFPSPIEVHCQKHAGHAGDHYFLAHFWVYPYHRLSGSIYLVGRAEFLWNFPDVWILGKGLFIAKGKDDGTPRAAELEFTFEKEEEVRANPEPIYN